MKRILFVCLGNICRSPVAHAVAKNYVESHGLAGRIEVDSCGTSSHHNGEQADSNTRAAAQRMGVDLEWHRSRRLRAADYTDFDVLVAMDGSNERTVLSRRPDGATCEVVRFMDYVPGARTRDVPDPYYEGGFEGVHRLVESGIGPLIESFVDKRSSGSE